MLRYFLSISMFFIAFTVFAQLQGDVTYEVNEKSVSAILEYLSSDALEGRDTGSNGIEKAAFYLKSIFEENGVQPYFKTYFDTLSNFPKPAYNVVGWVPGSDPLLKKEFVIIGAHYDHIGIAQKAVNGDQIVNGANDNASGSTAVAEIAQFFGKHNTNKRSVLFVFFSGEEKGLLGSKHLAKKLKEQGFNLYVMLNFEMIGVPMKRTYDSYITGYAKSNMADKFNEYAGKEIVGFLPLELQYRLFTASDNYPFFLEFNVPAQTVCTFDFENYEYYHHPYDEFERMDTVHMTSYIQDMLGVVEKMINAGEKEIVLKKK